MKVIYNGELLTTDNTVLPSKLKGKTVFARMVDQSNVDIKNDR